MYIQNIFKSTLSSNAPTCPKTKKVESVFSKFDWLVMVACGAGLEKNCEGKPGLNRKDCQDLLVVSILDV